METAPDLTSYFLRAWEFALNLCFKYPSRCALLKNLPAEEFHNRWEEIQSFGNTHRVLSRKEGMICRVTDTPEDLQTLQHYFDTLPENISSIDHGELLAAELISKVLAYRELQVGEEVAIPIRVGTELQLIPYLVDHLFKFLGKGNGMGLIPKCEGDPLLLFRGTNASLLTEVGRATVIADLDPEGPGHTLFCTHRPEIRHWMEKVGGNVRLFGHSLGAAFVNYVAISEPDVICQKSSIVAFNAPGVSKKLFDYWHNLDPKSRPYLINLQCQGDLVSKFGYLIGDVYELNLGKKLSPMLAHERLHFAESDCTKCQVDVNRENLSESRKLYSKIQTELTKSLFTLGLRQV